MSQITILLRRTIRKSSRGVSTFPRTEELIVEEKNNVVKVTLNRPNQRNATTVGMMKAFSEVLGDLASAPPKVVIVTGAGQAFCAGRDLKLSQEMRGKRKEEEEYMQNMTHVVRKWLNLNSITIAQVNGAGSFGFGLELAIACDLRYTIDSAKLCFPEVGLGIIPGAGGSLLLPGLTHLHIAKELILTSKVFSGAEAAGKYSLFNDSFIDDARLAQHVNQVAEKLASCSDRALFSAKKVMNAVSFNGLGLDNDKTWKFSHQHRMPLNDTPEFQASLDAFAKRIK
jgi:enoyl-CoA hydratase/carnithine racemase